MSAMKRFLGSTQHIQVENQSLIIQSMQSEDLKDRNVMMSSEAIIIWQQRERLLDGLKIQMISLWLICWRRNLKTLIIDLLWKDNSHLISFLTKQSLQTQQIHHI